MAKRESYDWLDDPFDDKKNAPRRMGGGSKAAVGIGCALAVVLIIALAVCAIAALGDLAGGL